MSSGLALRIAAAAAVLVTAITVVLFLPDNLILQFDQYVASYNHYQSLSELSAIAQVVDDLGRRLVILPVMLIVLGLASLRMRNWWPVFLGIAAFFVASVIVGFLKFLTQRTSPRLGPGDFGLPELVDTIGLYPSGHAANAAVAWGCDGLLFIHRLGLVAKSDSLRNVGCDSCCGFGRGYQCLSAISLGK